MSPWKLALVASATLLMACSDGSNVNGGQGSLQAEETASQSSEKPTEPASSKPIKPGNEDAHDMDKENALAKKMLGQAPAGTYALDKTHGYIAFSYDHQGYSKPQLRWGNWDSVLEWNPDDLENSSVAVTINVADVDTGVEKFNDHLRSADFFEVETYPTITFESTSVKYSGGMQGQITGDLTVKDLTKPITIDVVFNKAGETKSGHKVGFSGKTKMLRSEWGVGAYVPFVGDEVELIIEVEYERPAPE